MDQIEEVRSKLDIVQFISESVSLKKAGRNYKGLCPFHAEKTPSFMVSPERQIWKCFGCGRGGSVFNFLMETERIEFGEALKILAKRVGVKLASYHPSDLETEKEKIFQVNHLAAEFYHYLLMSHAVGKNALIYALGRGIKKDSLELFKIGYAPNLPNGLQKFLIGKKGYKIEDLVKAGLVSSQNINPYDFFRDRLIFPLKDHRGNFVGFSGRTVGVWEAGKSFGPKYMNTPETKVYYKGDLLYGLEVTKEAIKRQNRAIIVEGELDLISSYQVGIENVVAIKGSALTETQVKLLKRFCDDVTLTLDTDLAGDMAARRGIEVADAHGLNIRAVRLPEGKDPDELARKNPEELKKAIENAIPVYDFYLESSFNRHDSQKPEEKKKIGEELLPIFAKISDEIVKSHYLRQLANRLGVSEEAIIAQTNKLGKDDPIKVLSQNLIKPAIIQPRRQVLEEYLFSLVIQGKKEDKLKKVIDEDLVKTPTLLKIFKTMPEVPPELAEIYNNLHLHDFEDQINDEKWLEKEAQKTIVELFKLTQKEKLQELSIQMASLEKKGKREELEKLEKEFREISQKLEPKV
jgi:DNA primase